MAKGDTVTRIIEGDKEGIIAFLRERLAYASEWFKKSERRRDRDRYKGERDGLEYAIDTLEDWEQPVASIVEDTLDSAIETIEQIRQIAEAGGSGALSRIKGLLATTNGGSDG